MQYLSLILNFGDDSLLTPINMCWKFLHQYLRVGVCGLCRAWIFVVVLEHSEFEVRHVNELVKAN